jgi:hypothetical protein
MRTIIVRLAIFLQAAAVMTALLTSPVQAQFDPLSDACTNARDSPVCREVQSTEDPLTGPEGIILQVANVVAIISGAIAVVILVIAGLQMITSQGDSGKVKSARDAIIFTSIGLVVIVFARGIVVFIINRVG